MPLLDALVLHKVRQHITTDENRKVFKTPGISTVQIDGKPHNFKVNERDHPHITEVLEAYQDLLEKMKAFGYKIDKSHLLHDLKEEQEIEEHLCGHSEKLAIMYGILKTGPEQKIRVTKNLRVCPDCHTATKFISKVTGRAISVRDASRWHHYTPDGNCSCGDYW